MHAGGNATLNICGTLSIFLLCPRMLQSVQRHSAIVLTVTVNGMQQIHPVIYLLLTVTVNGMQQIHPVIYLLLTVTVSGMQQIHPVIYLLLTVTVSGMQKLHPVIYLLLTVSVSGMQQIHPVDISPIKAQSQLIDYGLWGFYRVRCYATSRTVPGSINGGVTWNFFRGSFRQNHVP